MRKFDDVPLNDVRLFFLQDNCMPSRGDAVWSPLYMTFRLVGLSVRTIVLTRSFLLRAFETGGLEGLAEVVKSWQLCVRAILADEDRTRFGPSPKVAYAMTFRKSMHRHRLTNDCAMKFTLLTEVAKHQGNRGIPVFLLDKICIQGMLPDPSFKDKAILVELSNIKRTLPEPVGSRVIEDSLRSFRGNIEGDHLVREFDFTTVANRFCKRAYQRRDVKQSDWKLSVHACLELSQSKGGKMEAAKKFILEFLDDFCQEVFPVPPSEPLYDIFGHKVLDPEDWSVDTPIWAIIYPELGINGRLDERFGVIGILWAINHLLVSGDVEMDIEDQYGDMAVSHTIGGRFEFVRASLTSRVEPLREEGWKVRVITITNLASAIIGQVIRHICDPIILTDKGSRLGLRSRVKLYSVLSEYGGGPKSISWHEDESKRGFTTIPGHAESIDLTCATDCPNRSNVKQVVRALFESGRLPKTRFNCFAVELGLSDRRFVLPTGFEDLTPMEHRCGIMMGEGLSGIYLNVNSAMIRFLAIRLADELDDLPEDATIQEIDSYVLRNGSWLQEFLDTTHPLLDSFGSNSGDDVVQFTSSSCSTSLAFKVLYRMEGMRPSESTWYSSGAYATFTEESAIRTHDSSGWKFVDAVKSRVFQVSVGDPDGNVVASKIRLLSQYMRYQRRNIPKVNLVSDIADAMLSTRPAWERVILRHGIPVGLPGFAGGLDHPVRLLDGYEESLADQDKKVLFGLSNLDSFEALSLVWEVPDDDNIYVTEQIQNWIRSVAKAVDNTISCDVIMPDFKCRYDLNEILPQLKGERWQNYQLRVSEFKRNYGLVSLIDYFSSNMSKFRLKLSLSMEFDPEKRLPKKYRKTVDRLIRLRKAFEDTEIPDGVPVPKASDLVRGVMNKVRNVLIDPTTLDDYDIHHSLPCCRVPVTHSHGPIHRSSEL